jgi:hypothetical protein
LDALVLQVSASIGVTFYPQDIEGRSTLASGRPGHVSGSKVAGKNRLCLIPLGTTMRVHHVSLDRIRGAETKAVVLHYRS